MVRLLKRLEVVTRTALFHQCFLSCKRGRGVGNTYLVRPPHQLSAIDVDVPLGLVSPTPRSIQSVPHIFRQ